jgi:hypothetical protein
MSAPFEIFCAQASLSVGEPLAGSAAEASLLLCVEDRGAWPPKPPHDWTIAAAARARIAGFLAQEPRARLQLIKRGSPHEGGDGPLTAFVADLRAEAPSLWRLTFEHHGQLADLDLEAFARGEPPAAAEPLSEPLLLVCTHGKRDRCCARHGVALMRELEGHPAHDRVWQTSHLGGHRFAATAVAVPSGYCYGRLQPSDAFGLVDAADAGQVLSLALLRGRMGWPEPVQAADIALRRSLDEHDERAVGLVAAEALAPGHWRVTLEHRPSGRRRAIDVERHEGAEHRPPSCGKAPEAVWTWVAAP